MHVRLVQREHASQGHLTATAAAATSFASASAAQPGLQSAMSRKVNFNADVSAASPSDAPNRRDSEAGGDASGGGEEAQEGSMHVPGSRPSQQASLDAGGKAWVPARLELRLRCERIDGDGSRQCVWMLQDDEAGAEYSIESLYFKGSKNDD